MNTDAQVQAAMQGLRQAESGSVRGQYGQVRVISGNATKVGAYGVRLEDFKIMAEDAGLAGASWRDPKAQDAVVGRTLSRLHAKYGDWRLVMVAWKAGEEVADAVASNPELLTNERLAPVAEYSAQVMKYATEVTTLEGMGETEGLVFDPDLSTLSADGGSQPVSDAGRVLRRRLYAMRERVRNAPHAEGSGEVEPDNDADDLRKSGVM